MAGTSQDEPGHDELTGAFIGKPQKNRPHFLVISRL
jgi:hypothetical protein